MNNLPGNPQLQDLDFESLTPLMKQYWEIKRLHMDKILLFRMGDFFEIFFEDAKIVAPLVGITLTKRNKKSEDETPMCGVPHHSIAGPINKLLGAGYKIAICDQIEDPKEAKGIVKRAVTRILSPGMVYDPTSVEAEKSNYLCSFDEKTLSFLESTTGEFFYFETPNEESQKKLLQLLTPVELVLSTDDKKKYLQSKTSVEGPILSEFQIDEEGVKKLPDDFLGAPESSKRLLLYAMAMQGASILNTVGKLKNRPLKTHMELSETTLAQLEIFKTYLGEKKGSLFDSIDRTKTSAGARLLKNWLMFPLVDLDAIQKRQAQVEMWKTHSENLRQFRELIGDMGDIERRIGKLAHPTCNARDLLSLADSVQNGLEIEAFLQSFFAKNGVADSKSLLRNSSFLDALKVTQRVSEVLVEEPPIQVRSGNMFRLGYYPELDELIELSTHGQKLLLELEAKERELTEIPSLKIKFNQVFGYYFEVTNTHRAKVPARFERKQTLVNAERFVTPELRELEGKLLSAKVRRDQLEYEVFSELRDQLLQQSKHYLEAAIRWSEMDVLSSLAWLAIEMSYEKPHFANDLKLKSNRHPVIEQISRKSFVPNDLELRQGECLMLTGPNMAGKSTLMRQVALTAILAQIGSFVPALSAEVPIFDAVYTRIGASDFLTQGLSTFMVEMQETSFILKNATSRSLLIFDEIGRGTSTYDGMSLAQAILEYVVKKIGAITFFATHYHGLTRLESDFPQIRNGHMAIRDFKGEIEFLHTLVLGASHRSYGIEVAKLAGLPQEVVRRAALVLKDNEMAERNSRQLDLFNGALSVDSASTSETSPQIDEHPLLGAFDGLDLDKLTPKEALDVLYQWKQNFS